MQHLLQPLARNVSQAVTCRTQTRTRSELPDRRDRGSIYPHICAAAAQVVEKARRLTMRRLCIDCNNNSATYLPQRTTTTCRLVAPPAATSLCETVKTALLRRQRLCSCDCDRVLSTCLSFAPSFALNANRHDVDDVAESSTGSMRQVNSAKRAPQ